MPSGSLMPVVHALVAAPADWCACNMRGPNYLDRAKVEYKNLLEQLCTAAGSCERLESRVE
jgi:hypothetical protein